MLRHLCDQVILHNYTCPFILHEMVEGDISVSSVTSLGYLRIRSQAMPARSANSLQNLSRSSESAQDMEKQGLKQIGIDAPHQAVIDILFDVMQ